jgi:uncharacterized protein YprB with RNaseH-like and TPR domain
MLTRTFCHIPGVGDRTEQALWASGLTSWDVACPASEVPLPRRLKNDWDLQMSASAQQLERGNVDYFAGLLPANQHWRLYREFQDSCAFLDIETTGDFPFCEITTIALYDGREIRHYTSGENLRQFPADVRRYKLLVTYNGKSFDIPTIEGNFGIRLRPAHIDLRYTLRSVGLTGGLKACAGALGLAKPDLEEVDGRFAMRLWDEYRLSNDPVALRTLLAYNIQDILYLPMLMVHAYNEKVRRMTPFGENLCLPSPTIPENPFHHDRDLIERIIRQQFRIGYDILSGRTLPAVETSGSLGVRITLTSPSFSRCT